MDNEAFQKSPAVLAAERYFGAPSERHEKGSGLNIVAVQREATAAKTARLKAAREAHEAAQTAVEVETVTARPRANRKKRID